MPPKPKLVLFDCDGVLVDSEPVTEALLRENLAEHGLHLGPGETAQLFTGGTMVGAFGIAKEMGAALPDDWVDQIYTEMFARLAAGTPKIDGIETLLDQLDAAGIAYAVGSNGQERKMEITLGQHPALYARLKGRIYSAHTVGVAKPDPGLYLAAAKGCGVDPADCVVVDDSPSGCRGGVSAGIRTLGYAAHDDGARLKAVGAEVFHSMADVPGLIGL